MTSRIFFFCLILVSTNIYLVSTLIPIQQLQQGKHHIVSSFRQLGQSHCSQFPIQTIWRVATGRLSQVYGVQYAQFDCYIRKFVSKDGMKMPLQQEDQQQQQQQQQEQQTDEQKLAEQPEPEIDPIVEQYSLGLSQCLPVEIQPVQAVYAIWRFYRYLVQNDYLFEWMRAKIRSTKGYQAQKPNSWMDGQQKQDRLRLDKLYSNQFYDYIDKMMFNDFLYPLITFLKQNTVVGINPGVLTENSQSFFIHKLVSKNYLKNIFYPVLFQHFELQNQLFAYTIPGIPLLFSGVSKNIAFGFTGVLVDRSNVQQIQTVGNKFYHYDTQMWIKLQDRSFQIFVLNDNPYICKYMQSAYGPLYQKKQHEGKIEEYIVQVHQQEPQVRNIFSKIWQVIKNNGQFINIRNSRIEFPWNSLMIVNSTGVFNYFCPPKYPSYFIYPDMPGQPDQLQTRWLTPNKKGFLVFANKHLTTIKLQNYFKRETISPLQQQYIRIIKKLKQKLKEQSSIFSSQSYSYLFEAIMNTYNTYQDLKQKQQLLYMYRKAKFVFFPEEKLRKQCDQLVSMAEKWKQILPENSPYTTVFKLWQYFFKKYSFSYAAHTQFGKDIIRYKALTQSYWSNQMELYKIGTSYSQCDCNQWEAVKQALNGTGLNSTCFFNVMRSINKTRQIILQIGEISQQNINKLRQKYEQKKILQLSLGSEYKIGQNQLEDIFDQYKSINIGVGTELGTGKIIYLDGYQQNLQKLELKTMELLQDVTDDQL